MRIKNYNQFINENLELNEGLKNWLTTAMILVSLGLIPQDALSMKPIMVEEIVDQIPLKNREKLKFIEKLDKKEDLKFIEIEEKWKTFSKDSIYNKDVRFLDFLSSTQNKNFPIDANVFLIDLEIPGEEIPFKVPLYSLSYDFNDNVKVDLSTTGVGFSAGVEIKDKLRISFLNVPDIRTLSLNIPF